MVKVKTFTSPIMIFHAREELDTLEEMVNQFIRDNDVSSVVSVCDACTTDDSGCTIGIIRTVAYE